MTTTLLDYVVLGGVAVTAVLNVVTALSLQRISKMMIAGRRRDHTEGLQ